MIQPPTLAQRLQQRNRPKTQQVMYQTWRDLLFLHWEIDPAIIQATLPDGLHVDTFDDKAYIGLVPFYMDRVRPRFLPAVPWISWFLEFNVRTYVHDANGTPGVWFYSLDCNQPIAVWAARTFFRLPYFNAKMTAAQDDAQHMTTNYRSWRKGTAPDAASRFEYRPQGELFSAEINTLEFFLVERYILFANTRKGLASGQVHHQPYQITAADVTAFDTNVLPLDHFSTPSSPPVNALYSPGVAVDVFPLQHSI